MASFNKIILIGNLTRDPELRYLPSGKPMCRIGMAMNRVWTNEAGEKKEDVTFTDVEMFGRTAENVATFCHNGSPVMVEGRLQNNTWNDKTTGEKRSRLGIIADYVQFLGSKREEPAAQVPSSNPAAPSGEPEKDAVPF